MSKKKGRVVKKVVACSLITIGITLLFWIGYAAVWNITSGYGVNLFHPTIVWRGVMIITMGALSILGGCFLMKKRKAKAEATYYKAKAEKKKAKAEASKRWPKLPTVEVKVRKKRQGGKLSRKKRIGLI